MSVVRFISFCLVMFMLAIICVASFSKDGVYYQIDGVEHTFKLGAK